MGGHIPDMEVLLAGGTKKPVGELKVGDKVETLHQHSFERQEAEVSYVRVIESSLLELILSGKSFTCSEEDQFYSPSEKKWIHAVDLSEGNTVSRLDDEVIFEGKKKIGKGRSVELTVDGPHTYICDGVLLHNKGGSPPPPTIIMPPPPPPPQIVTDVTPKETYSDASDYLRRMHERDQAIDERRWNAGMMPEQQAARFAAGNLRDAELDYRLNPTYRAQAQFGSQTDPRGDATAAVINALTAKPQSGSASRDARIRPGQLGPGVGPSKGSADRLAAAQDAYAAALAHKAKQDKGGFKASPYYQEFEEPSWADRDWYPVMDEWAQRSDPMEVTDPTPKIIKT